MRIPDARERLPFKPSQTAYITALLQEKDTISFDEIIAYKYNYMKPKILCCVINEMVRLGAVDRVVVDGKRLYSLVDIEKIPKRRPTGYGVQHPYTKPNYSRAPTEHQEEPMAEPNKTDAVPKHIMEMFNFHEGQEQPAAEDVRRALEPTIGITLGDEGRKVRLGLREAREIYRQLALVFA